MNQWHAAMREIMQNGVDRIGRNGHASRAVFGMQYRYRMTDGFPAVTTKRLAWKAVVGELLCFLQGKHNLADFHRHNVHIWDEDATKMEWIRHSPKVGEMGRIYGVQWRDFSCRNGTGVDQIEALIKGLKEDPFGRRHVVTAWHPGELKQMCLPPCHMFFQCFVDPFSRLSLHMYQRSCDMFLGVPFNIASYSLLLHWLASVVDLKPYEFVHTLGDAHIYHEHFSAVQTVLERTPRALPKLVWQPGRLEDFEPEHFHLLGYHPHESVKAPLLT